MVPQERKNNHGAIRTYLCARGWTKLELCGNFYKCFTAVKSRHTAVHYATWTIMLHSTAGSPGTIQFLAPSLKYLAMLDRRVLLVACRQSVASSDCIGARQGPPGWLDSTRFFCMSGTE